MVAMGMVPSESHFKKELAAQLQGGQSGGSIRLCTPSGSASMARPPC